MMVVISLVALVVMVTNQSVRFLSNAAGGKIPANELIYLIGLQVPLLLGYLMPLGLYLAVLLTMVRLHLDSEMVVLSSCGMSRLKMTGMLLGIAFFVATFVFWLMAVAVPKAQVGIHDIYHAAAAKISVGEIVPGRFTVFDNTKQHVIFYAKKVEKNHSILSDVFLAKKEIDKNDNNKLKWNILVSKTAFEKKFPGNDNSYLVFDKGHRYIGVPGEKNYRIFQFKEFGSNLPVKKYSLSDDPRFFSFSKLMTTYSKNLKSASEMQWRLAMPISVFIFVLLAIPLSEVRPRYGKFTQLFPAMLIYLAYADAILYARTAIGAGRLSPSFGMWWMHGIALTLAIVLMTYRASFIRIRHWFRAGKLA